MKHVTAEEYHAEIESRMKETEHQIRLFQEAEALMPKYPELSMLYHAANGEYREHATGGRLKAMGVKPGVPDICLPVARGGYHGLYIELKRTKKGARLSVEQKEWLDRLNANGYRAVCAFGWRVAMDEMLRYLEGA